MQETYTLARPYAMAAFKQAKEQGALDGWSEALETLGRIVGDPQIQSLAHNPKIDQETLTRLVLDVGGPKFFDISRNFVRVLVDAERLLLSAQVSELFDRMKLEAEGAARVTVLSAFEMSSDEQKHIADALQARLKRTISVTVSVDETLIGGIIVHAGDKVIDASVRGQLEQLALRLDS